MGSDVDRVAMVSDVADRLLAHWDTVVILCSGPAGDGSTAYKFGGGGNTFAQVGMAESFLEKNQMSLMEIDEDVVTPGEESGT